MSMADEPTWAAYHTADDPPPPDLSRCNYCPAMIEWARTQSGKRMPLDPEPDKEGLVMVTPHPDGHGLLATVLGQADQLFTPAGAEMRKPHFATCPNYPKRDPFSPQAVRKGKR